MDRYDYVDIYKGVSYNMALSVPQQLSWIRSTVEPLGLYVGPFGVLSS